jgi:hypothetical protein
MIRQAHVRRPPSRLRIAAVSIAELLLLAGLIAEVLFFCLIVPSGPRPS